MKNILIALTIVLSLLFIQKDVSSQTVKKHQDSYIEDESFTLFHKSFYSDSTFQANRINFPLQGGLFLPSEKES